MPVRTGIPSSHLHRLIVPVDVLKQFDLLMMSTVMLETCREEINKYMKKCVKLVISKNLKMESVSYSKTSVTIYQSTWRHIPEHLKPHEHRSFYLQRRRFLVISVSVLDGTCNTLTLTSTMKPNKMTMKHFQYETRLPSVSRAKLTYAVENGGGKREGRRKWRHK